MESVLGRCNSLHRCLATLKRPKGWQKKKKKIGMDATIHTQANSWRAEMSLPRNYAMLRRTRTTESPRKNILEINRSFCKECE